MLSLREIQERMAAEILVSTSTVGDYVLSNGLSSSRRIQVYRNNRLASLTEALHACFPVVGRLLGNEFFDFAAAGYIQRTPLQCASLQYFGKRFPEYLQTLPTLTDLPYIPGVARLEWSCQEVHHASASPRLNLSNLKRVPEHAYSQLCLKLNSAVRLLRSNYPLLRIWQVNQPAYAGEDTVRLDEGGDKILIGRSSLGPQFFQLADGEYAFLRALSKGRDLQRACEQALTAEADFDPGAILHKHVSLATLVEFSLPKSIQ